MATDEEVREKRQWWVVNDGAVCQAVGLSCAPSNANYWWFPALGFSAGEGYHVFATEPLAKRAAIEELTRQRAVLDKKLAVLSE